MLTWCKRAELLYGATFTFKTLRVGFPTARVIVADAGSPPEARAEIERKSVACGAEFVPLERRMELPYFIEAALRQQQSGPAVFIDPDLCFWESIEAWQFTGLAAGRFIPRHHCEFSGCVSEPRLHTSLLWFPDTARLLAELARIRQSYHYFEPFRTIMLPTRGGWIYYDGAAGLYGAFPDQMQQFETRHLDAYDHLFAGTYPDSVMARLGPQSGAMYREIHQQAQQDYRLLKGCWRRQEEYFQSRRTAALVARGE
jgi:hypothetical protein